MDLLTIEKKTCCPFCNELISVIIDTSAGNQTYIEDCEVCCQAMQINYTIDINNDIVFDVECAS